MSEFLFDGDFEYETPAELGQFLSVMDNKTAIKILEIALNCANKQGAFGILETVCVYKCLEKLKEKENHE